MAPNKTPVKKKPAPKVPVTSVTPRATVKKPSAKQVAGARKVVANLAGVTPIGRGVKLGTKTARALQNKAAKEFGMSKGTTVGKAKALKKSDTDYKLGKGKNKNLKRNMDNAYATSIVGMPATVSKKKYRRTLPKPPVKK